MDIKCNLSDTEDPLKQIQESVIITKNIDESRLKKGESLNLDFSESKWILPCSALLLSNKIMESCKTIDIKIIPPKDKKVHEYLVRIGFPLGCKIEGDTFLPITHFTNKDSINEQVSRISSHIRDKIDKKFGSSVNYLLGELSDNIEQHSQFTHASIMTQYYNNKRYLDIGLFDNGITIPGLFEKKGLSFKDDCEALKKAIEGVSTKEEQGRGFGLRTSKSLVLEGLNGEMYIFSRKGTLILYPKNKEKSNTLQENALKGTLIYMRFTAPKKDLNIYKYIE